MKKLFLVLAAAFAMVACQTDINEVGVVAGGEVDVTFEVGTPTRAYSDGLTATHLQYAVYEVVDSQNELSSPILSSLTETNGSINNRTATVKLQLVTGNTYAVVFWAAALNAPYTVVFGDTLGDATMTVDYTNALSNDENRDAFFKKHVFTVKGAQTETIELRRPFAQLNIGTNDYTKATEAGYTPVKSYVEVAAYKTLKLATGNVEEQTTRVFDYANIKKDEKFPVDSYEYLAMNYLLVDADKETVDVKFGYKEETGDAKTRVVGSVPVQRNYRTNIYGQLLTSDVEINVEIKPEYSEPAYEADALYLAAAVGGEITLAEDLVLDTPLNIQSSLKINLNGKTISAATAKGNGAVVNIPANVKVEIVGGTIKSLTENGDAAINNAGELVLSNVTIEGAPLVDGGYSAYAVISSGKLTIEEGTVVSADRGCLKFSGAGETVINGGHFTNNDIGTRTLTSHVVDVEDGGTHKLTINGGTFEHLHAATSGGVVICNRTRGTVYVNGGNFSGGNYYGNNNLSDYGYGGTFAVTGGVYTAKPAAKYIVAGYKAVEKDGKYYVVANNVEVVSNAAELKTAIAAGQTNISLKAGIYDTKDFQVMGKTFTLKGAEDGVKIYNSQNNAVACTSFDMCTVTFENLTIETVGGIYKGFARMNGTYNNCTIVNNYFTCYGEHVFNNCTFNAPALTGANANEHCVWTYGAAEVEFNNCVFNYSDRCVNVYVDNGGNAPGITSAVTFTQCKFNTENTASEGAVEVNSSPFTAGVTVVLDGCTAPAYGEVVYVSRWDNKKGKNATITVDGELFALPVATAVDLKEAIDNKLSTIKVIGEIDLADVVLSGYNGTIIGGEGAVLNTTNFTPSADEAYQLRSQNLTFKNLTIKLPTAGNWLQSGFVGTGVIVFENCKFIGQATLNGSAEWTFNDCEFVSTEDGAYASFVYGAKKATFNRCSFSGVDRAAKVYGTGGVLDVEYNNCTFTSSTLDKNGVEIDGSYATTTVGLNNCSQSAMAGLYAAKGDKVTVYVDGVQQ